MLHNTLVPPKSISNPSRHFTTGMRTPTQKKKKKKKKKKKTKKKKKHNKQSNREEKTRQHSCTHKRNGNLGTHKQCTVRIHTHEPNPHSTIHAKLGSTTPHPQQGKRTAAFGGEILLSTVSKHDKLPTLGKFDT